jgi:hypothetical protein
MEDELRTALEIEESKMSQFVKDTVQRQLDGMNLMSELVSRGIYVTVAAASQEVVKLCGSKRSALRYWSKIRLLPPQDWKKTIEKSMSPSRGVKQKKVLAAQIEVALISAQKISRHLKISEIHKVALQASKEAGIPCPSCKWFERHFVRLK